MVRAPPPCGPRPGPRSLALAQTPTRVLGAPGPRARLSAAARRRPRRGRWRRAGDPRPSAHLKRSAAADWRARRGLGEGLRPRHWPSGAPVTVPVARRPAPAPRGPKQPRVPNREGGAGPRQGLEDSEAQPGVPARPPAAAERAAGAGNPRGPCGPPGRSPARDTRCPGLSSCHLEPAACVLSLLLAGA